MTANKTILFSVLLFASVSASASNMLSASSNQTGTTAVLELYTSEGCSSCPPADRWLSSLKPHLSTDIQVVPLAFHVDYWNYLGWEDVYSDPRYTKRQRTLGALNKQSTIYTPGFYLNANETRGIRKILGRIQKINKRDADWLLELSVDNAKEASVEIAITGTTKNNDTATKPELFMALYENNIEREIKRGENTGKTLTHDFVVRQWIGPLQVEHSNDSFTVSESLEFPPDSVRKNTGVAAIIYDQDSGEAIQALSLDLEELYNRHGQESVN